MTAFQRVDMAEVTRLTRLGRLNDAVELLQGRRVGPDPAETEDAAADRGSAEVLDLQPPSTLGGTWTAPQTSDPAKESRRPDRANGARAWRRPSTGLRFKLDELIGAKGKGTAAPVPPGARFDEASFTNGQGSRTYKLYIPSGYHGQPVPLVVMLHGCTQSPDDFAVGTQMNALAEEQVFLVAYPAQPQSANASKCWNWFNAGDQRRDRGEPSLIAGITRQVMSEFAVDKSRVYVAGLSAGGAAAAIMASAYPDLYAAVGVHSGLACGAAKDMPSAFSAMSQGGPAPLPGAHTDPIPTIVFHGDQDRTVSSINGDHVIAQSKGRARLRSVQSHGTSAGGVRYLRTIQVNDAGQPVLEQWRVHGGGHAWFGGSPAGSYTDPKGPDASREMVRFFLQHRLARSA